MYSLIPSRGSWEVWRAAGDVVKRNLAAQVASLRTYLVLNRDDSPLGSIKIGVVQ
jgi:hypothetical protein